MQINRSILIATEIWDELDSYDKNLKSKFIRAFRFISRDVQHPSLRTEVIRRGDTLLFRSRVDPSYRIHFDQQGAFYRILAVGPHRLQGIG
jgi:hypothetical protein